MKKIYVYVYMFILFFSLMPVMLFSNPISTATLLSMTDDNIGSINEFGYSESDWNRIWDHNIATGVGDLYTTTWKTTVGNTAGYTTQCGDITSVNITLYCSTTTSHGDAKQQLYISSTLYPGNTFAVDGQVYNTHSWSNNPATSSSWTWEDIDNLQAGFSMKSDSGSDLIGVYEMWVNVTYISYPNVTTDAATNIEYTSVTLNGEVNCGNSLTCGFWLGNSTTSSTSFWKNITCTGTYSIGESFNNVTTGLTSGKTYYVRAWANDSNSFNNSTTEITFNTLPDAPSNLVVSSYNDTQIVLTWTKGTNDTVIVRNTTDPASATDGTEIYNGTGQTVTDTGLNPSTRYYYRAYNWNNTWSFSVNNDSVNQNTTPSTPTNTDTTVVGTNNLNISWTIGTGANKTVVRESASSQPLTPTSGTELYNDTGSYVIDTSISQGTYYSLWSYNTTTGLFSERTNLTWYVVWVNAYDSSNGSNISGYSVFFSNTSGTQTHIATGCTNPTIINISDCPQGDNILIIVKKPDTYKDAVYYRNIAISGNYYINAYLTVNTTTALYYLQVVETIETEYGMYEKSISTASVIITKYINTTGEYKTLYSLLTDGSGVCNCYLEYGELYKISISKSGYDSTISDYIPQPPNEYGQTDIKTFKLTRTEETPPASYDRFYENITITTRMYDINTTSYTGYITIHYQDINTSTINTAIYLYELYNNTETYQNTTSKTNNNSYTISFYDINTTRIYKIILYYNNTADFSDHSSPYIVTVQPLHTYTSRTKFSIDDRITDIVGPFTIMGNTVGYAPVIAIAIGVILLVMLGPYNTGLGIIAAGLGLGITELLFSIFFTDTFPVLLVTLTPVLIILGILYMWTKRQGVEGL